MRSTTGGRASVRAILAIGASALALSSTPAWAQAGPTKPDNGPAAEGPGPAVPTGTTTATPSDDTTIVVTGSRLFTTTMDTPVPVTAVKAEELKAMDPVSLIASVSQLPQFYANQTPNASAFFTRAGTGTLNLRGLGVNRTLTLLNGRRFPSSSAFGGVDINAFPEAMIKSIETVTGGASAAYGTDAVAGVTNFLLDTEFKGLQASLQGGITSRGDARNWQGSVAFGADLGPRGHILLAGTRAEQDGVHNYNGRDWYRSVGALQINGIWTDYANVHSSNGSFDGVIVSPNAALNGLIFDRTGATHPFQLGATSTGAVGTSGARTVGGDGDDLGNEVNTIWPDTDRYSAFAYADYDVTDNITVFGQYVRGYNHQFQYNTPRGYFLANPQGTITIYSGNPYLPANVQALMTQNNLATIQLRRLGSIEDIGQAYFEDKTTQDVGTAGFSAKIGGGAGAFMSGWKVDGYYQYGRSRRVWDQYALRLDRVYAALDAVKDASGNIVCRVSTFAAGAAAFPGCQPLNLFGRGRASPAAVDYVLGNDPGQHVDTPLYFANLGYTGERLVYDAPVPKRNLTTFTQHLAELSMHGDLMEGWAGPISLAVGGSYRKESIYQVVEDTTNQPSDFDTKPYTVVKCDSATLGLRGVPVGDCANNAVGFQFSKVSNIQGDSTVKEAFGELLVPLVKDQPWMQSATLDGAVRWANYSGAGDIWAYKVGLDLTYSDEVRVRATYSRDVRAGNLSERFDKTGGAANVDDPRTSVQESIPVTTFSGGNPNIKPEKADTFTAGVVLRPNFAPGLSASVDWYRVEIRGAIGRVGLNEVLRRCLVDKEDQFCQLVTLVNDVPTNVGDQYVNVAKSNVQGIDFELDYHTRLRMFGGGMESLDGRVLASYLINRSDTGAPTPTNPTGAVTRFDGVTGLAPDSGAPGLYPSFKANANVTYRNGPFTGFLQARLIGAGLRARLIGGAPAREGTNIAENNVPAVVYLDARVAYDFDIAGADIEMFASATNLLDRSPPVTGSFPVSLISYAQQANTSLFDVLGQRFTAGVRVKL
jgi:outer membrane receptor protein involved in Fe transport